MRKHASRWLNGLRSSLYLEILEARNPVSEGFNTATSLASLAAVGYALRTAQPTPPPQITSPYGADAVPAAPHTPLAVSRRLSPARFVADSPPNLRATAHRAERVTPGANASGSPSSLDSDLFDTDNIALVAPSAAHTQPLPLASLSPSREPSFDLSQAPTAAPDHGTPFAQPAQLTVSPVSNTDLTSLSLMLAASSSVAAGTPAATPNVSFPTDPNGGSTGDDRPIRHTHRPRPNGRDSADPVYVLDPADRITLVDTGNPNNGYSFNSYSGWAMNLYAQVSGANVQSYQWTLIGSDFTSVGSLTSYNLQFTWLSFPGANRTNTVKLQTTNVGGGGETHYYQFTVISQSNPGYSSTRPTGIPTFPLLVPPDAVKLGQEMIGAQYYSLGEETGEVRTSFRLPTYNPGIDPVQLDYSSNAADPEPIFSEYYQLGSTVPSTVTATLYWNCTTSCAPSNIVATESYNTDPNGSNALNPGDIMDIALQYAPQSTPTGRYGYQITVNAGGTPTSARGQVDFVNESASPFGAGWSLDNYYQIVSVGGSGIDTGAILVMPYGESLWFASAGSGSFTTPPGDFSKLVQDQGTGYYTLTLQNQTKIHFNNIVGNTVAYETSSLRPLNSANSGNVFTFSYANASIPSQLTSITDFENLTNTFTYATTAPYELTKITDPDLVRPPTIYRSVSLGYNAANTQLTAITGPDPGHLEAIPSFHYSYGTTNDLLTLTDPRSNVTSFTYQTYTNRIDVVDRPDGTSESLFAQQLNGLLKSPLHNPTLVAAASADYSDPNNNNWNVAADWFGFGYALQAFDPLNDLTTTRRDPNGLVWLVDDPLARPTRTFYDQSGMIALPAPQADLTEIVLADASTMSLTYNSYNEVTTSIDPNGKPATFTYGPADTGPTDGTLLATEQCACGGIAVTPSVMITSFTYNSRGFERTVTDPNMNTVTHVYDYDVQGSTRRDFLLAIKTPNDLNTGIVAVSMTYDNAGNLLTYQDQLGDTTTVTPDLIGRVLNVQEPTNGMLTYTYDPASNQTSIKDPVGNLSCFHYDSMNRVDVMTDPAGKLTTYLYDNAGNLTDIIDPNVRIRSAIPPSQAW